MLFPLFISSHKASLFSLPRGFLGLGTNVGEVPVEDPGFVGFCGEMDAAEVAGIAQVPGREIRRSLHPLMPRATGLTS